MSNMDPKDTPGLSDTERAALEADDEDQDALRAVVGDDADAGDDTDDDGQDDAADDAGDDKAKAEPKTEPKPAESGKTQKF